VLVGSILTTDFSDFRWLTWYLLALWWCESRKHSPSFDSLLGLWYVIRSFFVMLRPWWKQPTLYSAQWLSKDDWQGK
jgi:hypothetical protein